MSVPVKIALCGISGRMGQAIANLSGKDPRILFIGGLSHASSPAQAAALLSQADVLVDFSSPQATMKYAPQAARAKTRLVIGTTGFAPSAVKSLQQLSRRVAILFAPNMSPGMNVLAFLCARAAAALPGFEASISEIHHSKKKDAPSGSAKMLAKAVGRPVPIVSQRVGDVVGDHTLLLAGPGERLELTHRALCRDVFSRGALDAAVWVASRKPGWYSMMDVLGLSS